MGNANPLGYEDEGELMSLPWGDDEDVVGAGPAPLGTQRAPLCEAPPLTPGPLGVDDAAEDVCEAPAPGELICAGPHEVPDYQMVLLEVEATDASPREEGWLDLTAENLIRFGYKERTNWPGAVTGLKDVVAVLREFGGAKFYVMNGKGKGKVGKRYLVFKGNPRKPGSMVGLRRMIRGNGQYSFKNPAVVQFGFGWKNALKSGAKGTVFAFVVVGGIDIVHELMQDQPSLRRLGVDIAVDVVKVVLSTLAAAAVAAGAVALTGFAAPVWVVAAITVLSAYVFGWGLDKLDKHLGITEQLQKAAEDLHEQAKQVPQRAEWFMIELLRQLKWCAMNPHTCY